MQISMSFDNRLWYFGMSHPSKKLGRDINILMQEKCLALKFLSLPLGESLAYFGLIIEIIISFGFF